MKPRRKGIKNISYAERQTILAILARRIAENPSVKTTDVMPEIRAAGIHYSEESVNLIRRKKYGTRLFRPSQEVRNKITNIIKDALANDPTTTDKELVQIVGKAGYTVTFYWISRLRRETIGMKRTYLHQDFNATD